MCNIIIESKIIESICDIIKKEYHALRVGLIINSKDISKYKRFLHPLKGLNVEVYIFDLDVCNTATINQYVCDMKGVECVFAIGGGWLIDLSKAVSNELQKPLYVVLTDMITLNVTSDSYRLNSVDNTMVINRCAKPITIYVDTDILNNMNSRDVANGFAYLLANNLFVCKMLYDNKSKEDILKLETMLKDINIFTATNIMSIDGKKKLIKLLFEISLIADNLSLNESICNLISIYSRFYHDELLVGERLVIFAMLILSLHEKLIVGDIGMGQFDISKRLIRLNALFHNDDIETNLIDNMCKNKDYINDLRRNKEYYSSVLSKCVFRVTNNISMLKRIYVDKGVVYNSIDINKYINSISLLADMTEDKMLYVLRDLGVLDNI